MWVPRTSLTTSKKMGTVISWMHFILCLYALLLRHVGHKAREVSHRFLVLWTQLELPSPDFVRTFQTRFLAWDTLMINSDTIVRTLPLISFEAPTP